MSAQMESERQAFGSVSSENRKLTGIIEELNLKIQSLEAQVISRACL